MRKDKLRFENHKCISYNGPIGLDEKVDEIISYLNNEIGKYNEVWFWENFDIYLPIEIADEYELLLRLKFGL